jgi:hypothetical protein
MERTRWDNVLAQASGLSYVRNKPPRGNFILVEHVFNHSKREARVHTRHNVNFSGMRLQVKHL